MIERKNYLKVNEHLVYLKEVMQLSQASVDRYRFYLRHLLLWAGEKAFSLVTIIRPTLPIYFCLLYTSPSPRDRTRSRMPSYA